MEVEKKLIGSSVYSPDLYVAGAILEAGKVIAGSLERAIKEASIRIAAVMERKNRKEESYGRD